MTGYMQSISIVTASGGRFPCKLFESFDGVAHITDGWTSFVQHQVPNVDSECVFRFDRVGPTITVYVHLM